MDLVQHQPPFLDGFEAEAAWFVAAQLRASLFGQPRLARDVVVFNSRAVVAVEGAARARDRDEISIFVDTPSSISLEIDDSTHRRCRR